MASIARRYLESNKSGYGFSRSSSSYSFWVFRLRLFFLLLGKLVLLKPRLRRLLPLLLLPLPRFLEFPLDCWTVYLSLLKMISNCRCCLNGGRKVLPCWLSRWRDLLGVLIASRPHPLHARTGWVGDRLYSRRRRLTDDDDGRLPLLLLTDDGQTLR